MTKPVTIPNTFATATTAIPLSNLDADFSTVATAMNDANTYSNYAPDTGSANAYVVTLTGVSTTYSAGLRIQFKAGNANTTASTLNVNAQGAKNITYQDASAIASGTIAANSIVDVMYDGTQFLLMNDPAGGTGGDVVGPALATDNAIVRFDGATGKLIQNSVVTIADSTGDISGVGQLNATTVDTTNIEVTNIKAKDGTAAATIADSTGVVTVTAAPVMTALTASQAVFTTAGKALTSNAITGTGNVVMSASPTLTGTISAAAATLSGNLTLSGGTANGVLYLDGSKVATSGSALTFDGTKVSLPTTLAIKGAQNGNTAKIAMTRTDASYSINNETDLRFYGQTTDTESPANILHAMNTGGTFVWNNGSGTEQMRLTSTGLGIGTSSPSCKLDVVKPSAGITARFTDGDGITDIYGYGLEITRGIAYIKGSGALHLGSAAGYSAVVLDSSGNLGLGVTPSAWYASGGYKALQVGNASLLGRNSTNSELYLGSNVYDNSSGSTTYITSNYATRYTQNNGVHAWLTAASGTAGNAITFTQALTLDANRNLLLNGTTAGTSSVGTFAIFNGTAPTGSVTNGCILYAEDVSSSSELKVRDEAGNVTTLSPHNFSLIPEGPSEDMAWSYYSERDGRRINIDMLKAIRLLEKISGEQLVYEA